MSETKQPRRVVSLNGAFLMLLTLIFVWAKLFNYIDWPWFWVFWPLWIVPMIILAIGIVGLVIVGAVAAFVFLFEERI